MRYPLFTDKPHGDRGPKIKRPALPDGDLDMAVLAQIVSLLTAISVMSKPPANAVWWASQGDVSEALAAIKAMAAANPKVLYIDDSRNKPHPSPQVCLTRHDDFVQIATIYFGSEVSK